ncbi:MAG: MATE family efflux transporter, partial [Lachnospiraceae bacterium]|nr:MATE family efflux transporter [Lachnospiraceae bacterium]
SIYSLVVSLIRQMGVLIPVAYALSLTGKLELVWLAFPIAEIAAIFVTLFMLRHMTRFLNQMFGTD